METELNKVLSWEIDNPSERTDVMKSDTFSSGGCNWFLGVCARDHLYMYLKDVDTHKLRPGWKRRVSFCFVLLNKSGKELFRSPDEGRCRLFCAEAPDWGLPRTFPLTKLREKGFLEKNKLTIEVYMKVFEVVQEGKSTENDVLDYNGFHIFASQANPVGDISIDHPDFALDVIPKNQAVRTVYMNLLLGLVETLRKSPQSLSVTELRNAQSELTQLTEAGFKLDWLNSKIQELSLERKKVLSDGPWVTQLEEHVKIMELNLADLKVELNKEKASPVGDISAHLPDFAVDVIPKNQGVKTSYMKEACFNYDSLNSRLEELSLERKKTLSDGSRIQQLEEHVKNLELTLSDLKVELDKEMIKSAQVSSFDFVDFLIKRFFLSCFSISKY
ncbi:MATH domain and coiled-coil domain-containing protein At2g42470 isoform X2 [Raphanus sativus]|uniref:MATH domain and coiled-coil domain-containing protein At2g42470 isoform X2 n=1 Tax=Raphanus sativus TaxID=3726 RepID=A0A6J0JCU4_RAPSA|nr:MATH domain and coiled-coil domain-containing protein At2g42470 isoform X2 [Raphanus sativus]